MPIERSEDRRLDELLSDPIARLIMLSDGVSETEVGRVVTAAQASKSVRQNCVLGTARARFPYPFLARPDRWKTRIRRTPADLQAIDRAENEGMILALG